jgi:hypothetical protein
MTAMMLLKILPILPCPAHSNQPHAPFAFNGKHYQHSKEQIWGFQWSEFFLKVSHSIFCLKMFNP